MFSVSMWDNLHAMKSIVNSFICHHGALLAGIIAGISSPAAIGAPVHFQRLQGGDMSRIRGDVARVGKEFSAVMERERGDKAASQDRR